MTLVLRKVAETYSYVQTGLLVFSFLVQALAGISIFILFVLGFMGVFS